MKPQIIGKGLALAVILLFIGLGVQPAIAEKEQNSENGEGLENDSIL